MHRAPPENAGGPDALAQAITQKLPDVTLRLASDYSETLSKISDVEIVVEHQIDDAHLEAAEELRWIQSLSSGYDRFDLDRLEEDDIVLTTASGVHGEPIAQHVLGYILTFERGLHRAHRQQAQHMWRRFAPSELTDKTVTIVGVGEIGSTIAERLAAFDVRIIGVKRNLESVTSAVDDVLPPADLHGALGQAEYVVVACPLTPQTRQMFGPAEFDSMSTDTVFINIARGEIVDQQALITALHTGELGGAALDVAVDEPLPPESPLWDFDDVLITPHMAGGSPQYARRCAEIFRQNYERYVNDDLDGMKNRIV
ncbi:D-isomer specific 2-hydroxyacid dehydrogenase NAD-binding protein [Natrialba magadii ATCC 43099]|nr:D-isomer specific 2-hydroxyacid dehydrogenase NAD-binding protein [Natrialba magadii ATCC 43099]